jgi:hypothetical protein
VDYSGSHQEALCHFSVSSSRRAARSGRLRRLVAARGALLEARKSELIFVSVLVAAGLPVLEEGELDCDISAI